MIVEYKILTKVQQEQFNNIYLNSFPANERRPLEKLLDDLHSGNYIIYSYLIENEVNAIACIYAPASNPFALLDYFAVINKHRGRGLGSVFFRETVNFIAKLKRTLVLEVEDPDFGNNQEQKLKRIQFYEKNGAFLIKNYHYILPGLDGKGQTTEMILMIAPETYIDTNKMRDFILLVFENLYLCDSDNKTLLLNLKNLPDQLII